MPIFWKTKLPSDDTEKAPRPAMIQMSEAEAIDIAERTLLAIGSHGYCLWRCLALAGDIIVVYDRERPQLPYPSYSLHELEILSVADDNTMRLLHEAKKTTRAVLEATL